MRWNRGWPIMALWALSAAIITAGAAAVFYLVLAGGVQPALRDWEREVGRSLAAKYTAEIERIIAFTGTLSADDLEEYLMPDSDPSRFLVVFDAAAEPIFWYHGGRSRVVLPSSLPEEMREPQIHELTEALRGARLSGVQIAQSGDDPYELLEDAGLLTPFGVGAEPVGTLAAGTLGYESTAANRGILSAFLRAVVVAIAATAAASITVVLSLSARLERGLASLSSQIHAVTVADHPGPVPAPDDFRIREYRVLSSEIDTLSGRLEQERRIRRNWALDIAHDLRTPLAGIRAQLEAVRDGVLELDSERVRLLLGGVENLESLTRSFLMLTKVEAPDYRVEATPVECGELVDELAGQFEQRFAAAGRPLAVGRPGTRLYVQADRDLLVRALDNLLENAFTHGDGGGVKLSCDGGGEVSFSVENRGEIPPELAGSLFDRFARSPDGGHGLGLALVDAIARVHGGSTFAENGDGMVRIGFRIPAAPPGTSTE
jgi:signal transduction histidine kinase